MYVGVHREHLDQYSIVPFVKLRMITLTTEVIPTMMMRMVTILRLLVLQKFMVFPRLELVSAAFLVT